MSWYVDAWAVRDGLAFASYRETGSIDAESTVFMSVPSLEPVPVGRIATALRATRSGFQRGLYDGTQEVAFETLVQVQHLVRRAYLISGAGPAGVGLRDLPRPPDDVWSAGAQMIDDVDHAFSSFAMPLVAEISEYLHGLEDEPHLVQALAKGVRNVAGGTVLAWEEALAGSSPVHRIDRRRDYESEQGLIDWYLTLLRVGVWDAYDLENLFEGASVACRVGWRLLRYLAAPGLSYPDGVGVAVTTLVRDVALGPADLLTMCPFPYVKNRGGGRLSDVVLATVGGTYSVTVDARELCAIVLAGMALRPAVGATPERGGREQYFFDQIIDSAEWVSSETQRITLPPTAERLLARYAEGQTSPDHGDGPPLVF